MRQIDAMDEYQQQCQDTTRRTHITQSQPNNTYNPQTEQIIQKKKYGNMLVLYDGAFLITLGPDYWCFIPTFIFFCTGAFFMLKFMLTSTTNIYLILATIIVCIGTCLSYLLVATSNPGIITQSEPQPQSQKQSQIHSQSIQTIKKTKICRRCNITVKRSTYHCVDCDVCISDYDHHCPWTSKCIGGGNLFRFYAFIAMIPIFIVYCFVALGIMLAQTAVQGGAAGGRIQNIAKGI